MPTICIAARAVIAPVSFALLTRLAAQAPALGADGERLAAAIMEVLAGRQNSLDAALGLRRRGGISLKIAAVHARRDDAIRAIAAQFYAGTPAAAMPATLAKTLLSFQTRSWPRLAMRETVPAHLVGTADGALFALFKLGDVPVSRRQLARILAGRPMPCLNAQADAA